MKNHDVAARVSLGVFCTLLLFGCGTSTTAMNRSDLIPAAEATLKVTERKDANNKVRLKAEHLAPPDRVGGAAYVVWIQPIEVPGSPRNVGVLQPGDDLSATVETLTTWDKFEIFVTLEPSPRAVTPTGQRVLWASHT